VFKKTQVQKMFCGHNVLKEGVLVTRLSGNAGILVWRTARVTTNCCIVSVILPYFFSEPKWV